MAARDHVIPDQTGKIIVVTGGNAGLGAETVRRLASHNPRHIFLCARTLSKAEALIADIRLQHPDAAIMPISLDLTSLESARTAAAQIQQSTDRIDQLYLNAGTAMAPPGTTQEGYEVHFGVNHVAHALFTQLLMPVLLKTSKEQAADVRIIVVSSNSAQRSSPRAGIDFPTLKSPAPSLWTISRYGQSKLANILFARKLSQLYPAITSVSLHPGVVMTELGEKSDVPAWLKWVWDRVGWLVALTVQEGAKTQVWAGTAGEGVRSGGFYVPFGEEHSFTAAEDEVLMEELWRWTNEELKEHGGGEWPKVDKVTI